MVYIIPLHSMPFMPLEHQGLAVTSTELFTEHGFQYSQMRRLGHFGE